MTKGVPHRMRRIEVGARNPSRRQSFRGCVGSFVPQQLRKNVRMRTLRALAVCRRNRLKDLDASDPANEHPVWACCQDHGHGGIAVGEERLAYPISQRCDRGGVAAANAGVELQGSKAKVKQSGYAILGAQCAVIRANLGKYRSPVHGAGSLG